MGPSTPRKTLAVFDIDGTLTDSVQQHQAAFVQALEAFGFTGFSTDWGGYRHHTDRYIFKTIFERQMARRMQQADLEYFGALLHDRLSLLTKDLPVTEIRGAGAYLQYLSSNGSDIVLATGSLLAPALLKLHQAGIGYIPSLVVTSDGICSRDELVVSAIATAQEHYRVAKYDAVWSFGDGRWDYETACKVQAGFIGIGNEALLQLGVTRFYKDFADPAAILL